jgi:hypothetical protein
MTGWGNAVGWAAVNLPYGRWRLILVNGPRTGRPSSIRLSAVLRIPSKVAALENAQASVVEARAYESDSPWHQAGCNSEILKTRPWIDSTTESRMNRLASRISILGLTHW